LRRGKELAVAKCINCGGVGYTVTEEVRTAHGCDGSEQMCQQVCPVPEPYQEQHQCQWCDELNTAIQNEIEGAEK